MMENPIKMDDLGVPLFLETPIWWQRLPGSGKEGMNHTKIPHVFEKFHSSFVFQESHKRAVSFQNPRLLRVLNLTKSHGKTEGGTVGPVESF